MCLSSVTRAVLVGDQDRPISGDPASCHYLPLLLLRRFHSPVRRLPCPSSWLSDLRAECEGPLDLGTTGRLALLLAGECDASRGSISSYSSYSNDGNSPSLSGTAGRGVEFLDDAEPPVPLASRILSRPVARLLTRCAFLSPKFESPSTSLPCLSGVIGACKLVAASADRSCAFALSARTVLLGWRRR